MLHVVQYINNNNTLLIIQEHCVMKVNGVKMGKQILFQSGTNKVSIRINKQD